ncbi:MAG: hypothetical protein ABI445_11660 [Polyangia bacterium]
MGIPAALAKRIAEAKTTGGGNNIKDGNYGLLIKKLSCEGKFKGTCFIAEFDVVDSEKTHATIEPNTVGSDCSFVLNLDKNPETALGNLKGFYCGLLGVEESAISQSELADKIVEYCSDDNKARGMLICASTYRKVTQKGPNAGKEGVYPRFSPVDAANGNAPADIAKRRAELDAERK